MLYRDQRGRFYEHLCILEQSPACQGLGLHSFLMLPMQRITRFPLLIDAVLKRLDQSDEEYPICQSALSILNHVRIAFITYLVYINNNFNYI